MAETYIKENANEDVENALRVCAYRLKLSKILAHSKFSVTMHEIDIIAAIQPLLDLLISHEKALFANKKPLSTITVPIEVDCGELNKRLEDYKCYMKDISDYNESLMEENTMYKATIAQLQEILLGGKFNGRKD